MRLQRSGLPGLGLTLAFAASICASATAQGYKVKPLKAAPPASLAPKVLESLSVEGYKVVNEAGKPFAEIWLRKAIPASGFPAGAKGKIQFPFLADGEFLGVLRFDEEGRDFRDQSIAKGVYSLRYAVQPISGGHRGTSVYRDFVLLVPSANDAVLAEISGSALHEKSAESAGTTHPACLMLLAPSSPTGALPSIVHDEEKATWGANLPWSFAEKGTGRGFTETMQIIIVGAAMAS